MGDIKVGQFHETSVAGVFAAGDCVNFLKHVPGAVNEGFLASMGTHLQLTAEDLEIARNASLNKAKFDGSLRKSVCGRQVSRTCHATVDLPAPHKYFSPRPARPVILTEPHISQTGCLPFWAPCAGMWEFK
jgi:hypothetical protein